MQATSGILKQIKDSIQSIEPDATVILYGSYARGDYRPDSDIDILVLLNKDKVTVGDRMRIGSPLYRIEPEADIHISPVFRSKKLWATKHIISPFYKNVTREGILL